MTDARGYYARLGVASTATPREIKRAFRARAKALHPDAGEPGDHTAFQALCEAYQILGNGHRRAAYDQIGDQAHPVGQTLLWVERSDDRDPPRQRFSWRIASAALLLIIVAAIIGIAQLAGLGRDRTSQVAKYDFAEPTGPPAVSRFDAEADAAAAETLALPRAPAPSSHHRPAR